MHPPPMPGEKRRNSVLRLYDAPVYRDWAFWLTVGNAALGAASMPGSQTPSTLPLWLDMLLAAVILGGLFGVLPAWLRLLFRRWRWRRQSRLDRPMPPQMTVRDRPAMPYPVPPLIREEEQSARPFIAAPPVAGPPIAPHQTFAGPMSQAPVPPDALAFARQTYPHPIARAVRVVQHAHTPRDQYEAVIDAGETLAVTISVTAAALLNAHAQGSGDDSASVASPELSGLKRAYVGTGATFGTWTSWLTMLSSLTDDRFALVPGLREALQRPGEPSVVDHLNALKAERNRAAHGDRPQTTHEAALRVAEILPHLDGALRRANFLPGLPWLLTVSSSYQPRSGQFKVTTRRVMGEHPDFEKELFLWPRPVADDMFYVHGPRGPLTLSPFVASRFCGHCRQLEVCYAYKTHKRQGPAFFKSFDSGHDIPADELGDDLRALPDRG
jgi:hypothetical protein